MKASASYRLGLTIVAGTILLSFGLVTLSSGRRPTTVRAGRDLGNQGYALGSYRLIDLTGKAVTEADFADDVWVAAFIFTRCPASCPRISAVMKSLQAPLGSARGQDGERFG